jgi:hypothetical protein
LTAIAAAVLVAGCLGAVLASADEPVADRVDLGASDSAIAAQRARWQTRFHDARQAVVDAHLRHIDAMEAYRHMRHRDRERGEEKVRVMEELRASEVALAEAEAALDTLLAAARRAGVPPGWMPDPADRPAAPSAAGEDAP